MFYAFDPRRVAIHRHEKIQWQDTESNKEQEQDEPGERIAAQLADLTSYGGSQGCVLGGCLGERQLTTQGYAHSVQGRDSFPDSLPAFSSLLVDPEDQIWAGVFRARGDEHGEWQVFNEGR